MKKILLQLDTDEHASPFDAIVAYDAGTDELLTWGGVTPDAATKLVQAAIFTRGPDDLKTIGVWVGGSNVALGEEILAAAQTAYFGPFRASMMLDCNGCNTTAATAMAMLSKGRDLGGKRALVLGLGPVGIRSGTLLHGHGCEVVMSTIPADVLRTDSYHRPRGVAVAEQLGHTVLEPANRGEMEAALEGVAVVLVSGPAGVLVLPKEVWASNPTIELIADFNAAEPLGVEGVSATDQLVEIDGKVVLGALAIGGLKMKVHRRCVASLFERNDLVLDIEGVYEIASEMA